MLTRDQMVSILSAMADDKLLQAMSAVGIDTGGQPGMAGLDLGEEEASGIQSWNARDVSVPPANKPALFDKQVIEPPQEVMAQDRAYLQGMPSPELGGLDAYQIHQLNSPGGG